MNYVKMNEWSRLKLEGLKQYINNDEPKPISQCG